MEIIIYRRQRVHYGEQNDATCLVPKFACCVPGPSQFFPQRFSIERSRTASPGAVLQRANVLLDLALIFMDNFVSCDSLWYNVTDYSWSFMTIHDLVWLFMILCDYLWSYVTIRDHIKQKCVCCHVSYHTPLGGCVFITNYRIQMNVSTAS